VDDLPVHLGLVQKLDDLAAGRSSLGWRITRSIQAPICFISDGPMPRLVTAGVPSRMPEGSNGLRVS
jgi:hypothetical protein